MFLDPLVSFVQQFAKVRFTLLELFLQSDSHVLFHFTQPRLTANNHTITTTDNNQKFGSDRPPCIVIPIVLVQDH